MPHYLMRFSYTRASSSLSRRVALSSVETTVLMTAEETLDALAKSKTIGYRRPGDT